VLPGSQPSVFWRIAEERSYNHSRTVGHVFENPRRLCFRESYEALPHMFASLPGGIT